MEEYWLTHRPSDCREYPQFRLDRIMSDKTFPEDILTNPRMYFPDFGECTYHSALWKMRWVQGRPDAMVKIYRGAPSDGVLNTGDWVTLSEDYAAKYAEDGAYSDNTESRVYEYSVKASDLSFDGDSFYEFGYWGAPVRGTLVKMLRTA